jgi:Zn-dependent peptidase ImmA (M78 family)
MDDGGRRRPRLSMTHEVHDPFAIPIGRRQKASAGDGYHWFGLQDGFSIGLFFEPSSVRMKLLVGNTALWGAVDGEGVKIDVYALLTFFGSNWNALWLEGFPQNSAAESIAEFRREMQSLATHRRGTFYDWSGFYKRHCLTELMSLEDSPSLGSEIWLIPVDDRLLVDAPDLQFRALFSHGAVMSSIERACNMIARHAMSDPTLGLDDAVETWNDRNRDNKSIELVKLYAGISNQEIAARLTQDVRANNALALFQHNSEVLAAARMRPVGLSENALLQIIELIDHTPKVETAELDRLSEKAQKVISGSDDSLPVFEVAYFLARWLRSELNVGRDDKFDPAEMLKRWGVLLQTTKIHDDIDAIAFWGIRHGPSVIINDLGRYSRGWRGRRATYAHEICHLLVDRGRSLPFSDIVGGRVPEMIERRARAFAAEILLPQDSAYEAFVLTDGSLHELSAALVSLMKKYAVSRWIAAYQLRNGIARFAPPGKRFLAVQDYLTELSASPELPGGIFR